MVHSQIAASDAERSDGAIGRSDRTEIVTAIGMIVFAVVLISIGAIATVALIAVGLPRLLSKRRR